MALSDAIDLILKRFEAPSDTGQVLLSPPIHPRFPNSSVLVPYFVPVNFMFFKVQPLVFIKIEIEHLQAYYGNHMMLR